MMGNAKNIPADKKRIFLPFQSRWVNDRSRLKIFEKSRQIGVSWATAYRAVETTAPKENRNDQWVSSRDEIQAKLFLEDCKLFAAMLNLAAKDLGSVIIDEDKKLSAYVLHFTNNKRIHSMSSNPDAQAGKRGGRILDEFALHPDPRKLYSIAYPGITWGGGLEIISTHRGTANFFNQLIEDVKHRGNPKKFSLHTVTLQDALDQGFLYKLQQVLPQEDPIQAMDETAYFDFIKSGCASEEIFLQEYMCLPADDAGAFLSYDEIAAVEYRPTDDWQMDPETGWIGSRPAENLYIGVDIGRKKDLTVAWVLELTGGMKFTRHVLELSNTPFSLQEAALYPLFALPQVRRVCIDNTGLGMQLAERAQERFGTYKIEPVTFTGLVKEALAYPLKAAVEDKAIRIPYSDHIRADLRAVKKTTTAAGNIRFEGETKDSHADRFWGLALANHAATVPVSRYAYEKVTLPKNNRDEDLVRPVRSTSGMKAIGGMF